MAKSDEVAVKKVKVTINSGEGESDKGDVVLVHNYKQIQIQRDQEVEIDSVFLGVLKDARVETEIKDDNGNIKKVSIPRFSYSVTV